MSDLKEAIDQIEARAQEFESTDDILDAIGAMEKSQADVPRLVGVVKAVMNRLKEPEDWHIYNTRDIGEAYSADTVMDFIRDLEAEIACKLEGEDDE